MLILWQVLSFILLGSIRGVLVGNHGFGGGGVECLVITCCYFIDLWPENANLTIE